MNKNNCVIISGCSGGGKTTIIKNLSERGWKTVPEAGRQIVQSELIVGGDALPWKNAAKFVEKASQLSRAQIETLQQEQNQSLIITDRSIIDLISYLGFRGLEKPAHLTDLLQKDIYTKTVFIMPPWQDIFESDIERPKGFHEAVVEYDCLRQDYLGLGYDLIDVPKGDIHSRVLFIENYLSELH